MRLPNPGKGVPHAGETADSKAVTIESVVIYVSSWFTYHAGQRVQNFYFFLAYQGAIAAFLGSQYDKRGSGPVLIAIGALAMVGCVSFFLLEIRNTELIIAGRSALSVIEKELGKPEPSLSRILRASPVRADEKRVFLCDALGVRLRRESNKGIVCFIVRHIFAYRFLFTIALVAWLLFLIYAIWFYQP